MKGPSGALYNAHNQHRASAAARRLYRFSKEAALVQHWTDKFLFVFAGPFRGAFTGNLVSWSQVPHKFWSLNGPCT
ncbi:hypothetical protein SKAU_G00207230 [Synaphobranchus kaupii]|uniref:Uncharacterized protein n=1 Tax=Synaphobranchus kaupii TaxID=118154 RepID=A0A9Q1F850_SYNKA|nr:hypothetical protein SKAU_G00207230 [Synaphobranchus kaupii]